MELNLFANSPPLKKRRGGRGTIVVDISNLPTNQVSLTPVCKKGYKLSRAISGYWECRAPDCGRPRISQNPNYNFNLPLDQPSVHVAFKLNDNAKKKNCNKLNQRSEALTPDPKLTIDENIPLLSLVSRIDYDSQKKKAESRSLSPKSASLSGRPRISLTQLLPDYSKRKSKSKSRTKGKKTKKRKKKKCKMSNKNAKAHNYLKKKLHTSKHKGKTKNSGKKNKNGCHKQKRQSKLPPHFKRRNDPNSFLQQYIVDEDDVLIPIKQEEDERDPLLSPLDSVSVCANHTYNVPNIFASMPDFAIEVPHLDACKQKTKLDHETTPSPETDATSHPPSKEQLNLPDIDVNMDNGNGNAKDWGEKAPMPYNCGSLQPSMHILPLPLVYVLNNQQKNADISQWPTIPNEPASAFMPLIETPTAVEKPKDDGMIFIPNNFGRKSVDVDVPASMKFKQQSFWEFDNLHIDNKTVKPKCNTCGAERLQNGKALLLCGNCRQVRYCNEQCQRLDWCSHRSCCKKQIANECYRVSNLTEIGRI